MTDTPNRAVAQQVDYVRSLLRDLRASLPQAITDNDLIHLTAVEDRLVQVRDGALSRADRSGEPV